MQLKQVSCVSSQDCQLNKGKGEKMKDMETVADYNYEEKLKFLRGMAFNNSSVLIAGSFAGGDVKLVSAEAVFDYAQALFDEAIRRKWLEYGKAKDTREISKETGITPPWEGT